MSGMQWVSLAMGALVMQTPAATPDRYGSVPIHSKVSRSIFPLDWRGGDVRAAATAITNTELPRSLKYTRKALAKYPMRVLDKNLKAIYLVRTLRFYGADYGATNSRDAVYLCNDGFERGFTGYYLEQGFHHEFSSILLRNFRSRFSDSKWTAANPREFQYLGDGLDAIRRRKDDIYYSIECFKKGFFTEYSQASIEEDLNTVAEGLFLGDRQYWQAVDRYPMLKRKCHLAISFYKSIDPWFTERRFRQFADVR